MRIGKNMTRANTPDKITGSAGYTADLEPQSLLAAKVIRSVIANGTVKSPDLEEARKMPEVAKIVTCFDVPDIQLPTPSHPWPVETAHRDIADGKFFNTRVRIYGDDVAAMMTGDDIAVARAARFMRVEYEGHAPLLIVKDAMAEGVSRFRDEKPGNVIAYSSFVVGEGTHGEAMKEEGLVEIEKNYRIQGVQYCHIGTPTSFAYMEKGRVIITTSTQIPHVACRIISRVLGLPMGRIRVIKPYINGGFDSKQDVLHKPLDVFLTTQMGGGGVRMEISREETLGYTRVRHAIEFKVKAAARKSDTLVARKLEAHSNRSRYVPHAHTIVVNSSNEFKQIYKDERVLEPGAWTVYTNLATGDIMRGYGIPQAAFAAECMTDDLVLTLHMDPLEFKKKNCMRPGYANPHTHVKRNTYGLAECIKKSRKFIRWSEKYREYENQTGPMRKRIGMAVFCYKTGVHPISLETASCRMILNQDGSMQLQMGATEIDQDTDTVFIQVAAEVTGIMKDKVNVLFTQDTGVSLFDTGTYIFRQTYVSGVAVKKTGAILKERILDYAAYMLEKPQGTLDMRDNHIVDKGTGTQLLPMEELVITIFYSLDHSVHITAEAASHCKTDTFATDAYFAEMEMDMPLGKAKMTDIVSIYDSEKLINPKLAAARVRGGMSTGLGHGLDEELLLDVKERSSNNNLPDYKLLTAMDTPDLDALFVELDDSTGPFEDEALGESLAIPVAPITRNVILNATGATADSLPIDLQKMVKHFREAGSVQKGR